MVVGLYLTYIVKYIQYILVDEWEWYIIIKHIMLAVYTHRVCDVYIGWYICIVAGKRYREKKSDNPFII